MFPCSSIYQNFPRTNQTLIKIDDQIQCYNSFQNDDDHSKDHVVSNSDQCSIAYNNNNNPHNTILEEEEDEAAMLSQLLACDSQQLAYNYHGHHEKQNPGKQIRSSSLSVKRSNKDRHSKIYTAHGLRDRRMRLSLQIARKFFDLQDLLGFDKASRTIDWLFTKSKTAIDELKSSHLSSNISNSTSGAEAKEINIPRVVHGNNVKDVKRKVVVLKDSRDKARARARARTREKNMLDKCSTQSSVSKSFHGCYDEAEPNNPFQVDFLGFTQNWEMMITTTTNSDHRLSPNLQNPRPALNNDSEKQNPNPNSLNIARNQEENLASDIFTLNF